MMFRCHSPIERR